MSSETMGWRAPIRRVFSLAHAWLGALSALFVIFVAGTGAALAFMSEVFFAQHGDMLRAQPLADPSLQVGVERLLSSAQEGYGSPFTPYGILMPHTRVQGVETALVYGMPEDGAGFEDLRMFSVDPWSGVYKGSFRLDDTWGHQLVHFHQELFAGEIGHVIVAALGLLLVVFALTGIWLWWPRNRSAWNKAVRLDLKGGVRRALFNLHGWAGVWAGLAIVVFSLSGTAVSKPHWLGLGGAPDAPTWENTGACAGPVTPGQAVAAARARHPHLQLGALTFPQAPDGAYTTSLRGNHDLDRLHGDVIVFVDSACAGRIESVDLRAAAPISAMSLSVHGGYSFGSITGDILVVATGLFLLALAISGLYVFFTRTLRRKRAQPPRKAN